MQLSWEFSYLCDMMEMMNEATKAFIQEHANDDVRKLALKGSRDIEVDMGLALQQIAGRQLARHKLPSWAAEEGILYPPHLSMEQCSSELTARYKRELSEGNVETEERGSVGAEERGNGGARERGSKDRNKGVFVDLTGGFGVDFFFMSQDFERRIYVEHNRELCTISSKNFSLLGLTATIVNNNAESYLSTMPEADVVFIDPARRNEHGGRTYSISDCTPNILTFVADLLQKSRRVIIKLSPMLDWHKATEDIETAYSTALHDKNETGSVVREVHIVSVMNECKELLLVVSAQEPPSIHRLVCVNLKSDGNHEYFMVKGAWEREGKEEREKGRFISDIESGNYLYEPNASIMKGGCFAQLCEQYEVSAVGQHSHLFVSSRFVEAFPGRSFRILAVTTMNKKELRHHLSGITHANISVRNFPMSAEELRKRLKLKDGGTLYLFATTLSDGTHVLIFAKKVDEICL